MEEKKVVCSKCGVELKGPTTTGAFVGYPPMKFCDACVRFTIVSEEKPRGTP